MRQNKLFLNSCSFCLVLYIIIYFYDDMLFWKVTVKKHMVLHVAFIFSYSKLRLTGNKYFSVKWDHTYNKTGFSRENLEKQRPRLWCPVELVIYGLLPFVLLSGLKCTHGCREMWWYGLSPGHEWCGSSHKAVTLLILIYKYCMVQNILYKLIQFCCLDKKIL